MQVYLAADRDHLPPIMWRFLQIRCSKSGDRDQTIEFKPPVYSLIGSMRCICDAATSISTAEK